MRCLPDSLIGREYYQPTDQGLEYKFRDRLEQIKVWRKEQESFILTMPLSVGTGEDVRKGSKN